MDLPNDQKPLQRQRSLKTWKKWLTKQRTSLRTPEELQRWQQRWDQMMAEKEELQLGKQKHQELLEQQQREAELKRKQQEEKERMEAVERQEQQERQEREKKEPIRLQRRQAMVERRQQIPELGLLRNNRPTPSPSSVLQLVFDYLSPVPGPPCTSTELLAHLRCLQRVAAVNREWRAAALPLFCCTVHVVIGHPLDPRDSDEDGDNYDDSEDEYEDSEDKEDEDSMDIDVKVQGKPDTFNQGGYWDSGDDEELLGAVGLARNGVDIGLRTNIGLLSAAALIGQAHEVQIIVQGMSQTAGQLLRQLLLAGFGRYEWASIERLRIDMRDSSSTTQTNTTMEQGPSAIKALNDFLSWALPSLREIEFYGPHSESIYGCVLIEQLIKERLHRPASLRAVRVKSDCWPKLTDDYDTDVTALPVYIECMEIDGPDETYLMQIPMMVADTLSLVLNSTDVELPPRVIDDYCWRHADDSVYSDSSDEEEKESEEDGNLYLEDVQAKLSSRFDCLPDYDMPKFPVLMRLELRGIMAKPYLDIFADSPISSLVLSHQSFTKPQEWDLSKFYSLRSLSIPPSLSKYEHESMNFVKVLSTVLSTVCPLLQRLSLTMSLYRDSQLRFMTPSFADSLISLTLDGEYSQHDVEHLLRLFPNLCTLMSVP
ncbi:hypothetical protein GGH93_003658 [Coemansia aciculifera]|nr:hypothetical protein GGH93_003658 [Coemansia aciculifera]